MAEGVPPHSNLNPIRVIFVIPVKPVPTLADPDDWSHEMLDFVGCCCQKDPSQRHDSARLSSHPFIKQEVIRLRQLHSGNVGSSHEVANCTRPGSVELREFIGGGDDDDDEHGEECEDMGENDNAFMQWVSDAYKIHEEDGSSSFNEIVAQDESRSAHSKPADGTLEANRRVSTGEVNASGHSLDSTSLDGEVVSRNGDPARPSPSLDPTISSASTPKQGEINDAAEQFPTEEESPTETHVEDSDANNELSNSPSSTESNDTNQLAVDEEVEPTDDVSSTDSEEMVNEASAEVELIMTNPLEGVQAGESTHCESGPFQSQCSRLY